MLLFIGFNSCKKDFKSSPDKFNESPSKQISNADIEKWAKENPVVKYLALDWKNAKETVYQGKQVVKITLLNENRFPEIKSDGKKVDASAKKTFSEIPKTYFDKHPPEVFLVKDDRDSIHSSLLNFIPDIETATYGTDNKWTGKLYEWNMNSDSLFVQEIKDNKALLRYIIGASDAPINNNAKNNVKTNISLSGIGGFFGAIGEFFSNVGYFLGIPGGTNSLWYSRGCDYTGYGCTRTWAWAGDAIGWMGENFFGSGSAGADGGSGFGFYNNYLPYYGYGAGDGTGDGIRPTGGGSSGFLPTYRERIHGPNIGNGAFIAGSIEANELINDLEITDSNIQTFLRSNDVKSLALYDYLRINGWSTENKEFIKWSVGYLADNSMASGYLTSHPEDFELYVMSDIDLNEPDDIAMANNSADIITDILVNQQNGTLNNLDVSWPNANDIKSKITNAISKGVYTTAKYARNYLYLPLQKVALKFPSTINYSNKVIDEVRIDAVTPHVNLNANTMSWGDLFYTWLFELTPGNFSNNTIDFTMASNVVNGFNINNPATNAVINFPKGNSSGALLDIENRLTQGLGIGQTVTGSFKYDVNAFYSTLSDANLGIQMLGSYPITATVISRTGNTAVVQFYIENSLGWESATRFIKGSNGNQGVIDNKTVGVGVHLGGTIVNKFTWTETIIF